jgi:hypothetical protein
VRVVSYVDDVNVLVTADNWDETAEMVKEVKK